MSVHDSELANSPYLQRSKQELPSAGGFAADEVTRTLDIARLGWPRAFRQANRIACLIKSFVI